ncbi:MAG TPA: YgaP-like transmembrane domain [Verrucomicrobiae bacterium]|nr:YgaP-like transmembrane domain [Verrucomicrobiae bacterium]
MKRFFSPNIDSRGRLIRGVLGGLLVTGGIVAWDYNLWLGIVLIVAGGFCLFEAVRGWCVMRACGIRTRL